MKSLRLILVSALLSSTALAQFSGYPLTAPGTIPQNAGVKQPYRPYVNYGSGFVYSDDPTNQRYTLTVGGGSVSVIADSPLLGDGTSGNHLRCPTCFTTSGGTLTGALLLPNGSLAVPALAFSSQTTLGIYKGGTNQIDLALDGTNDYAFTPSMLTGPNDNTTTVPPYIGVSGITNTLVYGYMITSPTSTTSDLVHGSMIAVQGGAGASSNGTTDAVAGTYGLLSGAPGGAGNGIKPGANGGGGAVFSGSGGDGSASAVAGTGGIVSIYSGWGGINNGGGSGNGGLVNILSGRGSAANGTSVGGIGGELRGTGGTGGASSASAAAGTGGALTLKSGAGGSNALGGGGGASGNVILDTGAATGAATNGTIAIGTTNTSAISFGKAGTPSTDNTVQQLARPAAVGGAIAAAATIAPTAMITHITGHVAAIDTITAPANLAQTGGGGYLILVFDDALTTWSAAGNIAVAGACSTAATTVIFTYDNATAKWYPSRIM